MNRQRPQASGARAGKRKKTVVSATQPSVPPSNTTRPAGITATVAVFTTTFGILALARFKAPYPLLLADRFWPGTGWMEILGLSLYAALLLIQFHRVQNTSRLRLAIWLVFSLVFFTQFVIGVSGVEALLMTGKLHVPVPAVVIGGPIYRGARFFMPMLFVATVLLVGPAWCSHLCYIGAWDGLAASRRRRASALTAGWPVLRTSLLVATPLVALALRLAHVEPAMAASVAVVFGVCGLAVMFAVSVRTGTMVHCTAICPLGLVGNLMGKISPFRIRISAECNQCAKCILTCRYNALNPLQIKRRRPAHTCTLCGDCLASCEQGALSYRFFGLSPAVAREVFLVLVVALHAVFLGVARI